MATGLSKKPVNGMKDIMPKEMEIRDYVTGVIKETYRSFGYTPIDTPALEDIGNLSSKLGGDNEKLIFKVLKRGEKLKLKEAVSEEEVVDYGLRYDLTVPLCRFYANNANELPKPFKALQIGNVYRADRPQRGRFRQFTQCDIDIIGEADNTAEIELILATTTTLKKLGFEDFEVRINERRILKAMALKSGFNEERLEDVYIILDKMDKIGLDGVKEELLAKGFEEKVVNSYINLFTLLVDKSDIDSALDVLKKELDDELDEEVMTSLRQIGQAVDKAKSAKFELVFDPTLVRGMSYYTGTIFEIAIPEFGGSCGGGGRYDNMIKRFTKTDVPACGFSIGFERIIMLLLERDFKIPSDNKKTAFLVDKRLSFDEYADILSKADKLRSTGAHVLVVKMNKNKKFQKQQLIENGYNDFEEFFAD